MQARNIMTTPVIAAKVSAPIGDVVGLLVTNRISAVPILDEDGKLVGILSEGDLLRRAEAGTERQHSRWLQAFISDAALAAEYIKDHSRNVADIMTRHVITVPPDMPLRDVAAVLERNGIKQVPVVENGHVIGIVSRSNIVQAIAGVDISLNVPPSDELLREQIMRRLEGQPWAHAWRLNVTVTNGVADVWGISNRDVERRAILVAVETVPGVKAVNDHLIRNAAGMWA
ncbi:CBS domain-containing protein [Aquabacter sp. CN5-332]|uniref:CBS domain-containing protein n=1 Tax=Aquabacter sp. CN5-332 TaxID=3156608 RepID=UPI0032B337A5